MNSRQRGQASVEMAIASAFLLVPLFLITPMVGKYVDMAQTTHSAAHYAAFERTVKADIPLLGVTPFDNRRGGAQLAEEDEFFIGAATQTRFFSGDTDTINAAQSLPVLNDSLLFSNRPFWTDHAGNPLVPEAGSVVLPGGFGVGGGNIDVAVGSPLFITPPPDLPALGLKLASLPFIGIPDIGFKFNLLWIYTSEVTLRPENPVGLAPFDDINLAFHATATVYGDGWSASHPGYTTDQIERVLPANLFQPLDIAIDLAGVGLPDLVGLDLGRVLEDDPCEVPGDRLSMPPATCIPLPFLNSFPIP